MTASPPFLPISQVLPSLQLYFSCGSPGLPGNSRGSLTVPAHAAERAPAWAGGQWAFRCGCGEPAGAPCPRTESTAGRHSHHAQPLPSGWSTARWEISVIETLRPALGPPVYDRPRTRGQGPVPERTQGRRAGNAGPCRGTARCAAVLAWGRSESVSPEPGVRGARSCVWVHRHALGSGSVVSGPNFVLFFSHWTPAPSLARAGLCWGLEQTGLA